MGCACRFAVERRELGAQAFDDQLVGALGQREAFETMLAEVAESHTAGQLPVRQGPRRLGDEHLAPMGGGGDPCGTVDIHANVVVAASDALAAMDAHAYSDLVGLRPGGGVQRTLGLHGRCDGRGRVAEDDEE